MKTTYGVVWDRQELSITPELRAVLQFDPDELPLLLPYHWMLLKGGYAVTTYAEAIDASQPISRTNKRTKTIYMHRLITKAPADMEVDHINGDRVDNRRCNLRLVTRSQNQHNAKVRRDNTSGHKGVCWNKAENKWKAYIFLHNRMRNLGHFRDIESAIAARLSAERELHGEYARNPSRTTSPR